MYVQWDKRVKLWHSIQSKHWLCLAKERKKWNKKKFYIKIAQLCSIVKKKSERNATRCYKFSICLFMLPILNSSSFAFPVYVCPNRPLMLFRILIVRYATFFMCVQNNNKRIILFDDMAIKIYFCLPSTTTEYQTNDHRTMWVTCWAIKSRIFTSLKGRALT